MDDTEADVKSWTETVAAKLRGAPDPGKDWWAALRLLEAAALEGAKVPGLVADNAVLYSLVRRAIYGKGDGSCTECGRKGGCAPDCEMAKEAAKHRPGATLLGELSALQAQVEDAEDRWKVAEAARKLALEQVATLERQGLDMARQVGELSGEVATLTAERDDLWTQRNVQQDRAVRAERERDRTMERLNALSAQVEAQRKTIDTAGHMLSFSDPGTVQRFLMAALSAPPAETTPAMMEDGHIQSCGNGGEDWRDCSPECTKAQRAAK